MTDMRTFVAQSQPGSSTQARDHTVAELVVSAVVPKLSRRRIPAVKALPSVNVGALGRDGSILYGLAALDDHGRLAVRHLLKALGWSAGQRIDLSVSSGTIVVRRNDDGPLSLTAKGLVQIPARIRRWCSWSPGERLLLVAIPSHEILMVYGSSTLDSMIVNYHTAVTDP